MLRMFSMMRFSLARQHAGPPWMGTHWGGYGYALPPRIRRSIAAALLMVTSGLFTSASAHPGADLEVGDPLEDELRTLDLLPSSWSDSGRTLPASHSRPLLRRTVLPPESTLASHPNAVLSWRRLERALHRDRPGPRDVGRAGETPYLLRFNESEGARFDLSARIEGRLDADPDTTRLATLSGIHLRGALGFDRWILQSHWLIGKVDSAARFGDPIVTGEDFIATTEQAIIAYSAPRDRWGARFGRGRWHWGPGHEASLLLSKTAAPVTALEVHGSLAGGRVYLTALSATLKAAAGEQLAAHRVEWRASESLRLGAGEAAVYSSSGWRPLYALGLLPYTVAQRLETQDQLGTVGPLRNNVMVSFDAAWRIAPGTRVYGELLVDDLHARTNDNPDKLGFQLGWDGVGRAQGTRIRWNGEYTRLTPYVYTSFFGREASAQGRPLGFPTGPDARRLRLWAACDPSPDFELSATATRTEKGENVLGEPFLPGSVRTSSIWSPLGVVERASAIEARVRWWPAGGVDVAVSAGYEWRENAGHVRDRDRDHGRIALEARVGR
ncbi:MAG: capsule assembly Wzi family protein [Candidatus Eisenbacteria bacterium]